MRFEFKLPDIGEGIAEAELVAWHVAVGDLVEEDAPLADVMTDKATVEMTAPCSGRVIEVAGRPGDALAIGSILAVFEVEGEPEAAPGPALDALVAVQVRDVPPRAATSSRLLASPAVRARAVALGVDLAQVQNGAGRVRHADLDAYMRYRVVSPDVATIDRIDEVPVIGLRRRIAERMQDATRRIAHFSYVEEIDVTALERLRGELNAVHGAERPKLTMLPFILRALVLALQHHPELNARYDDDANVVRRHSGVHVGIATQTDTGLLVPVVTDAGQRDLWDLAAEIARLAQLTREGRASAAQLTGSTITVTSLGALGGIATTPVINSPEVAIVGVNRMVERPVVRDGVIGIAKMMNLSSSFDHRVVDGHEAASFVQRMRTMLERPEAWFIR